MNKQCFVCFGVATILIGWGLLWHYYLFPDPYQVTGHLSPTAHAAANVDDFSPSHIEKIVDRLYATWDPLGVSDRCDPQNQKNWDVMLDHWVEMDNYAVTKVPGSYLDQLPMYTEFLRRSQKVNPDRSFVFHTPVNGNFGSYLTWLNWWISFAVKDKRVFFHSDRRPCGWNSQIGLSHYQKISPGCWSFFFDPLPPNRYAKDAGHIYVRVAEGEDDALPISAPTFSEDDVVIENGVPKANFQDVGKSFHPWLSFEPDIPVLPITKKESYAWRATIHSVPRLVQPRDRAVSERMYPIYNRVVSDWSPAWRTIVNTAKKAGIDTSKFSEPAQDQQLRLWRTAISRYFFKPKWWAKTCSRSMMFALGLIPNEYIAVHVRRGDKVRSSQGRTVPLENYYTAALKAKADTGISKLYVTSDENAVIADILEEWSTEFEIVYDKDEDRYGGPGVPKKDFIPHVLSNIKNMEIFTHARVLIGARMSFYFVLADSLRFIDHPNTVNLQDNLVNTQFHPL